MTLYHIALNNLRRRKTKYLFVVLGIFIGVAAVVCVYSVTGNMKQRITMQMRDYGANVVITPETGELTFSYGGITVPEVMFEVKHLSARDLEAVKNIKSEGLLTAVLPKLLGMVEINGEGYILAGSHIKEEVFLKPWLRLQNEQETGEQAAETGGHDMQMDFDYMDLERMNAAEISAGDKDVILGSETARLLGLERGDTIIIKGQIMNVAGVLKENGSPEDRQVFVTLEVARNLLEKPDGVSLIEIAVDYEAGNEEELLSELADVLPHARIVSLRQKMMQQDEISARFSRLGFSVSIMVLLSGFALVVLSMLGSVRERTREIGIFRSIGFRRTDIIKIILFEGFVLSIAGGIPAYFAGILAGGIMESMQSGMAMMVSVNAGLFFCSLALAVLVGLGAALYPACRAAVLDPVEAMRFI